MITLFCLTLVSAAFATEFASLSRTCTADQNGLILSGDTCSFQCCLAGVVRTMYKAMVISSASKRGMSFAGLDRKRVAVALCHPFPNTGNGCVDSGYRFQHKTVIKYNKDGCYICNNGNHVAYASKSGSSMNPETTSSYTLVRFG